MYLDKANAALAAAEDRRAQAEAVLAASEKRRTELEQQLDVERAELTRAEAREVEARIAGSNVDPAIADRAARNVRGTKAAIAAIALEVDKARVALAAAREAETLIRRDVARLVQADAIAAASPVLEKLMADLRAVGDDDLVKEVLATAANCYQRAGEVATRLARAADERRTAAAERLNLKSRRKVPVEPVKDTFVYTSRAVSYATPDSINVVPSRVIVAVPRAVAFRGKEVGALCIVPPMGFFQNTGEADAIVQCGGTIKTVRAGRVAVLPDQSAVRAGLVRRRDVDLEEVRAFAEGSSSWLESFTGSTSPLNTGDRVKPIELGHFAADDDEGDEPVETAHAVAEAEPEDMAPPVSVDQPKRSRKASSTPAASAAAAS